MCRVLVCALLVSGIVVPQVPAGAETGAGPLVLDARRCVTLALANNPRVAAAAEDVAAAEARADQARAARLPQVTADAFYSYIHGLPVDLYTGGALAFLTGEIEARKWQVVSGVGLEQVLFAGGRLAAAQRASAYLAQSQAWRGQAVRNEIEYLAKQAYHDALLARALLGVAEGREAAFERHLADSREIFEVGLVSRFQVLRAETELRARQAELTSARSGRDLSIAALLHILGLPQDTAVRLEPAAAPGMPDDPELDTLQEEAHARRPELQALDRAIAAAGQDVRGRRGQYLPRAGAMVRWEDVEGGTSVMPEGWSVGVGAEWELFTGGRRRSEVAEARARRRSLGHQREDVRQMVALEVRQAWLRVGEARASIEAEEKTVALAEEGVRMAGLRYREGVGTQAEVMDAEVALSGARTQLAHALRDLAVAHAALDKATGRSWVPPESPAVPE